MISSISNKWLAVITILVAGLGLTVGYMLIPFLEPTQTASVLVSTNNTTANNIKNVTMQEPTTNISESNASSSSDVNIVVKYTGNWAADISGNFPYRGTSGNGYQTINLGSVSGPVTVSARKTEGGSGTLTVSIEKGGKNLSTSSTSSPYGAATAYFTV